VSETIVSYTRALSAVIFYPSFLLAPLSTIDFCLHAAFFPPNCFPPGTVSFDRL